MGALVEPSGAKASATDGFESIGGAGPVFAGADGTGVVVLLVGPLGTLSLTGSSEVGLTGGG
jgi:hypothetical protein